MCIRDRYCGEQLRSLYETDPEMFTLDVLNYLSDLGLAYWCSQMWLQSADTSFTISREEAAISRALGFRRVTSIPGMGFGPGSPFVTHNIIDPYNRDTQIGVREYMLGLTKLRKQALRFSSVPYGSINITGTTLGGWDEEASTEHGSRSDNPSPWDWDGGDVGASADDSDPYYGEGYDMDPDLGASDGKGNRPGFGKGGQNGGRGSTGGRGGRGLQSRPPAAGIRTLKLSAEGTKVAFDTLPNVVDGTGNVLGVVCLRFCCRNGLSLIHISEPTRPY